MAAAATEERVAIAEALLLGAAGLLPQAPEHPQEIAWQDLGRRSELAAAPAGAPSLAQRPANHPARRLAGLARLLVRHRALLDAATGASALLELPARDLIVRWTVQADGYWRDFLAPGLPAKRPAGALIGRARAIEVLTNAVLPWAAALGDADGAERARACFAALPRPAAYGMLGFLEQNLGLQAPDARRQQGLLALYKTECSQGGCGRCVFS
jgi:hypothetical protein